MGVIEKNLNKTKDLMRIFFLKKIRVGKFIMDIYKIQIILKIFGIFGSQVIKFPLHYLYPKLIFFLFSSRFKRIFFFGAKNFLIFLQYS